MADHDDDLRRVEHELHAIDKRLTRVEANQSADEDRRSLFEHAMEETHRQLENKIDGVREAVTLGITRVDRRLAEHIDQEDQDRRDLLAAQRETINGLRNVAWTVGIALATGLATIVLKHLGVL